MSKFVSIITPTFNHSEYIKQCIESVQKQDYTEWEIIVVDDGSTDNTAAIIEDIAKLDNRIILLRQDNVGPSRLDETYNKALKECRGDLIAILEGDDFWPPSKLSQQVGLHESGVIMSYGAFELALAHEHKVGPKPHFTSAISSSDFLREVLLHRSHMLAVTQMISAWALNKIGGFQQNGSPGAVDMATLLALAQLEGQVVYSAEILGYWRQHEGQSTQVRGVALVEHNLLLALGTFKGLTEQQKAKTGISEREIYLARRPQLADAYLGATRYALVKHKSRDAVKYARNLWRYGNRLRKIQSIAALACLPLGLNLEPIFNRLEKTQSQ